MTRKGFVLLAASLLATPAAAQVHRSRMPTPDQVRAEYLDEVNKGTQAVLDRWRAALAEDKVDALIREFVSEGAHYSAPDGESHYGREAIREALGRRLLRVGAVSLTRVDFAASGNLVYQFGRYFYGPGPDGIADQGTYVMILHQAGRHWQIRSYVERRAAHD